MGLIGVWKFFDVQGLKFVLIDSQLGIWGFDIYDLNQRYLVINEDVGILLIMKVKEDH